MAPQLRWLANSLDGSDALIFESPWLINAVFAYTKSQIPYTPKFKTKTIQLINHQVGEDGFFFFYFLFTFVGDGSTCIGCDGKMFNVGGLIPELSEKKITPGPISDYQY